MEASGNMINVNNNNTCNNKVVCFPTEGGNKRSIGHHIARRLVEIGVKDVFSVPGDFNLGLLDYLVAEADLNLIGCCNELNAGYGADGYARCKGVGACVVTFNVGGLSILNAIAGAYSEDLPVICIVGAPNSNDYGSQRIIHHSIGLSDFSEELRCFQPVTCHQAVVNNLEDAHELIDTAIATALRESKPVYISIASNLVSIPHHSFTDDPVPFYLTPKLTDESCLEIAVEATSQFLNKAVKPVMVGGPKLRMAKASDAFMRMVDASGYPFAVLPSAKGMVEEHHPNFIGTYWGQISTPFCAEILHSADAYLFAGPVFNDVITLGFSIPVQKEKAIVVLPNRVMIPNGPTIGCVSMKSFFEALATRLKRNTTAFDNYKRIHVRNGLPSNPNPKEKLRVNVLFMHIQNMLSRDTAVIAETGDTWFTCQKLKLPQGCGYECQMQYGSIGWSVGASLGYAQAAPHKRVIACVGDGSFQMTVQEVSTMLRCGQNCIIFLINNGGYCTETEIHDGPYNVIKNWDYAGLVEKIDNGEGKCWTTKVHCEEELTEAIKTAMERKKSCLCFIEVIVESNDTSKELIVLGTRLSAFNGRPPKDN
ncbi:pyruvate decarboxylase 1-like [Vigna unguiculata]|uniref:pyruvate decarboxylase 1-like n=1 Tax=Vigna unguiculata TaxID=3917 RepID=UPI00101626AE|nr:pyruvate decarboxylase 1-like [Vigna unguiculata]